MECQEKPMSTSLIDETYWKEVRGNFVLDTAIRFFNNGTAGPASKQVLDLHAQIDRQIAVSPFDPFLMERIIETRTRLAEFVHADTNEVSFTHSTSEGMNIFAHGLDWHQGDEVILAKHEHFGGIQPYQTLEKRYGIKIVWIDFPQHPEHPNQILAAYRDAITPKTRVIAVSHVFYTTGLKAPIKELAALAHENNIFISVDGAQSLGVLPIDLRELGVDHYAGSGQKWLLAGTGTGFTYIARHLQEKIWPLYGYDEIDKPLPYPISRYEKAGQPNIPAWLGIGAAIQVQNEIGKDNIESRVRELSKHLREGLKTIPSVSILTPENQQLNAALTTISLDHVTPETVVTTLVQREKIYTRTIYDGGIEALRVSTHFYNTPAEIDHLVAAVTDIANNPPKEVARRH
jgi:selenocysteine lyase/cysteine desulfurase